MKIYCSQSGQMGDSIMSLRVSQYLKEKYPEAEIVGGIAKKYCSIMPVLRTAPYVKRWIIWDGYPANDCPPFPTDKDQKIIDEEKFDIFLNPNQTNHKPDWYKDTHQVADMFLRHGIQPPEDLQIHLPKPKSKFKQPNIVAFAPFPNFGQGSKCLSVEKSQAIVDRLISMGKKVYQLGSDKEPKLNNTIIPMFHWGVTVGILDQCEFLITTDTAVSWLASAYSVPTLGLYGFQGYYSNVGTSKNWQPINPNAIYLENRYANDIPLEEIFNSVDKLIAKS